MEGQIPTGQVATSIKVLRASSAIPFASFPIIFAVAGAIITASVCLAQSICFMDASELFSKRLEQTISPDNTSKVSGPTNAPAFSVMITLTFAPCFLRSLKSSTLLYAAIPPHTPSTMFLFFITVVISLDLDILLRNTLFFWIKAMFQ